MEPPSSTPGPRDGEPLATGGVPLDVVSESLGGSPVAATGDVHGHLVPRRLPGGRRHAGRGSARWRTGPNVAGQVHMVVGGSTCPSALGSRARIRRPRHPAGPPGVPAGRYARTPARRAQTRASGDDGRGAPGDPRGDRKSAAGGSHEPTPSSHSHHRGPVVTAPFGSAATAGTAGRNYRVQLPAHSWHPSDHDYHHPADSPSSPPPTPRGAAGGGPLIPQDAGLDDEHDRDHSGAVIDRPTPRMWRWRRGSPSAGVSGSTRSPTASGRDARPPITAAAEAPDS